MQLPNLKRWRELRGLTQSELGDLAGVSRRAVAGYEGGAEARPRSARKLAAGLNVDIMDLVGIREAPRTKGWLEPENAADLEGDLRERGLDLLAMDAVRFEAYLDVGHDIRRLPKRVLGEWARVRGDDSLRHLADFANHRVSNHLNAVDERAEEARGEVEEARAALA